MPVRFLFPLALLALVASACSGRIAEQPAPEREQPAAGNAGTTAKSTSERIVKSNEEWKKLLTPEQYEILREKGTEPAFTGKYYKNKETGMYLCAACGAVLFSSDTKYESGTGWPSFYKPEANVASEKDVSHGMVRTEVHCARCGGHLGHVFEDGPDPTGLRYCINSASLKFQKKE